MKNVEIRVGEVYSARVGANVVPVRVDHQHSTFSRKTGTRWNWTCTNLRTKRVVTVKSAQRFREHVPADEVAARLEVLA